MPPGWQQRRVENFAKLTSGVGGIQAIAVREPIVISPYHLIQRKSVNLSPLAQRLRNLVVDGLSKPLA